MAALTEDQQRGFVDRIVELYGKTETATAVAASYNGLDVTKRLNKLKPLQVAASKAEGDQASAEAAYSDATRKSQAATAAAYSEASGAADALASELGEDHPLSQQIRGLRGSMSNPGARGPRTPEAPKP